MLAHKKTRRGGQRKIEHGFLVMFREEALREQDMKCYYCLNPLTYKTVTADHVHPRSKGGDTRKENILASCRECNETKRSMPIEEFKKLVRQYPKSCNDIYVRLAHFRYRIWSRVERMEKRLQKVVKLPNEY